MEGAVELEKVKDRFIITEIRSTNPEDRQNLLNQQPSLTVESCADKPVKVMGNDGKLKPAFTETHCLVLVPKNLAEDTSYKISLAKGTIYHRYSGPSQVLISQTITGLLPFVFPFQDLSYSWNAPMYRRYLLWLRHGLHQAVNATNLKQRFSLVTGRKGGGGREIEFSLSKLEGTSTLLLEVR